jgi:hypothetical protein
MVGDGVNDGQPGRAREHRPGGISSGARLEPPISCSWPTTFAACPG